MAATATHPSAPGALGRLAPGLLLAVGVALLARLVAALEQRLLGGVPVETLVVAILLGALVRTLRPLPPRVEPGVDFAAKPVLELAVLLLGASVSLPLLLRAGPALAGGIVLLVVLGLGASWAIGRLVGLPGDLSVLVACGNAICGNSAIAAVAPVIEAERAHVASAIAFTAILGLVTVLVLPLLAAPLGLGDYQYGVLAGLTVYAVPQVLAATFPVSPLAGEVGTLVKLVRVLMLGPVVLFFALRHARRARRAAGAAAAARVPIARFVPWFIVGFLVLAGLRSLGLIPAPLAAPLKVASTWLTVVAMAALGLGVDVRAIARVGRPVIVTVTLSLLVLVALAVLLIRLLAIG